MVAVRKVNVARQFTSCENETQTTGIRETGEDRDGAGARLRTVVVILRRCEEVRVLFLQTKS